MSKNLKKDLQVINREIKALSKKVEKVLKPSLPTDYTDKSLNLSCNNGRNVKNLRIGY